MNFDAVEKIAATILYEGYILYPYRPSAIKNRQRWNFGTLYPNGYAGESCELVAECLAVGEPVLDVRIKFLQMVRKEGAAWDEAVERTINQRSLRVTDLLASPLSLQREVPTADPSAPLRSGRDDKGIVIASDATTPNANNAGWATAAVLGASTPSLSSRPEGSGAEGSAVCLGWQLTISAEELQPDTYKLRLSLKNATPLRTGSTRDEALPFSLVSAHLLLGVNGGEFVSLLDPAEQYDEAAATCSNLGVFPVLVGEEPDRSMMLCSPIILYDYPKIAPQSAGDFFDGTEMDEMLALRVLTLTDAEKQEMRNGDSLARKILERTEALTSEDMLKTHGVTSMEDWNPFAETKAPPESVRISGVELRTGDRVRLCPKKKADIFDMALNGKIAVIEAIEQDFEDQVQLAVVVDDDPGREFGMMRQPGHRFFFSLEEVEPA